MPSRPGASPGRERRRDDAALAVGLHGRLVPLVVRLSTRRCASSRARSTVAGRRRGADRGWASATRRTSRPGAGAPGPSTTTSASTRCCGCRCRDRWPTWPTVFGQRKYARRVTRPVRRFATVILVDPRGWMLLQERDEHAPIDPERWGLVGGHVEDGEDFEPAAHRELAEETGAGRAGPRACGGTFTVHEADDHDGGRTSARPRPPTRDVVCGEGRQIVFVDAGRGTRRCPLTRGRGDRGPAVPRLAGVRQSGPVT